MVINKNKNLDYYEPENYQEIDLAYNPFMLLAEDMVGYRCMSEEFKMVHQYRQVNPGSIIQA